MAKTVEYLCPRRTKPTKIKFYPSGTGGFVVIVVGRFRFFALRLFMFVLEHAGSEIRI